MKELLFGLLEFFAAILVSIFLLPIGLIYSLGYSIWLSITIKKWYAFFVFWWRFIDGIAAGIGYMLHSLAYGLDLMWNVNGEIIEDIITNQENTEFSKKNVTISASVGKLEIENKLNPRGKLFSKFLNFIFGQKAHAIDAWNYLVAVRTLKKDYFN
jgi:hypothetical protein